MNYPPTFRWVGFTLRFIKNSLYYIFKRKKQIYIVLFVLCCITFFINIYTNYSIKDIPISTETIHVNIPEHEDFEIINSFANKMLTEATPIDEEIQNVINDHFWDML